MTDPDWTPNPPTDSGPRWYLSWGASVPQLLEMRRVGDRLAAFTFGEADELPLHHVALFGPSVVAPPLPEQPEGPT